MALPQSICDAAQRDLAALHDPVGLQRAALEMVADSRCSLEMAEYAAGKCLRAVELRAAIEELQRAAEQA